MTSAKERILVPFEKFIVSGMNFKFGIYDLLKPLQAEVEHQIEKLLPEVKLLSIKYMNDKFSDE